MFQKVYTSKTDYYIWEVENNRIIDEHNYVPYLIWIQEKNTPEIVSSDRFITITNGVPVEDVNKNEILAKEEYARSHPQPAMDETLLALCKTVDTILLGKLKDAEIYNYIRMRWYTRDLTAADITSLIDEKRLNQSEADAIMSIKQVPLS